MMLEEVLAQQTKFVNTLHATELLCQFGYNGKNSAQISNEDTTKEVVKPCGPRAEPRVRANVCRAVTTTTLQAIVPMTDLDGSDVSSFFFDSPMQHERARVCMAAVTPKRQQPENTSISTDEGVSPFTSGDFASSPRTELTYAFDKVPDTFTSTDGGRGLLQLFMWETWSSKHLPSSWRMNLIESSTRFTLKTL